MTTVDDLVNVNGTTFNDPMAWWRRLDVMEGWEGTPPLDFVAIPNGAGPGALLGVEPVAKEKAITLGGAWLAESAAAADDAQRQLLDLFPVGVEIPVDRRGRRMYVWLADTVEPDLQTPRGFRWSASLIALDPFRYATSPETGSARSFTGDPLYRVYDEVLRARPYDETDFTRNYIGPLTSEAAYLPNLGDAPSRRVTIDLRGPVTAGEWQIVNETTGEAIYGDLTLTALQHLEFDTLTQTATLSGQDVTRYIFGDWLTLAPGPNVFRLLSGTLIGNAQITVSALSAWR